MTGKRAADVRERFPPPLKPFQTMLDQEIQQAIVELRRPLGSLLISAFSAGFGIGVSLLLVAVLYGAAGNAMPQAVLALIAANLSTVGFIIVILGRLDLFTEFTTIAVIPVLDGKANLTSLGRFWGLVYVGNFIGAAAFAMLLVGLGRETGLTDPGVLADLGRRAAQRSWWALLLSGTLAGWLMGMLSWLIVGGRETISQIFFIWLIALVIGYGQLDHSVISMVKGTAALLAGHGFGIADAAWLLLWATVGNAAGGAIFAASIHYTTRSYSRDGEVIE